MRAAAPKPHAEVMENLLVAFSDELARSAERAGRSVVAVHGRPRIASSGVHWAPGVIVTAEHTLRRDEDIRVTLPDGRTVPAQIAGRDPGADLAVLKAELADVPTVEPRAATDLKPGQLALAVGRSPDTGIGVALGVISGVSGPWRTWRGGRIEAFVRLDVALYPGCSGGAIVDASGAFIGLATGGLSRTSALAIPGETIAHVVKQILEKGHVAHGYLGVGLQPVNVPEHLRSKLGVSESAGLIAISVDEDGPAGAAGLMIGDVLLAIDGTPIGDIDDLQSVLGHESVGRQVTSSLIRGGALLQLIITVGERPLRSAS
jgi:S1-C subfamily serine protease